MIFLGLFYNLMIHQKKYHHQLGTINLYRILELNIACCFLPTILLLPVCFIFFFVLVLLLFHLVITLQIKPPEVKDVESTFYVEDSFPTSFFSLINNCSHLKLYRKCGIEVDDKSVVAFLSVLFFLISLFLY